MTRTQAQRQESEGENSLGISGSQYHGMMRMNAVSHQCHQSQGCAADQDKAESIYSPPTSSHRTLQSILPMIVVVVVVVVVVVEVVN